MLLTKEFAEICDTSKKTIIHYDRIGLLKPSRRRGVFRLYEPRQALTFQKIMLLKNFGMKLHEIKIYLHRNDLLQSLFEKKEKELSEQKITLEKRINKAHEFVLSLKTNKLLISPKIKIIKPYWIYALKKQGRYVDIASHQREIFKFIHDEKYHYPGLTIFHNKGYSPHNSKMTTCVYIGETKPKTIIGVDLIQVPEHKILSYTHIGSYSYMSYIWQFMDKYIIDNHLNCNPNLDCREIYWRGNFVEKNEDNLITELQIPLI
jgi:DNA-binding transcriptional MerR regulator